MLDFDALRKYLYGGNPAVQPSGNGLTGGTPPTMKNDFTLPNGGGNISVDPNAPQAAPAPFSAANLPTPQQGQQQAATQAMGPFANTPSEDQSQGGGTSHDDIASQLNGALYGVSGPTKTPGSDTAGMSPTQQYFALRGQQANDRANGTGLYFIDPSKAYSPDQIRQIHNAADEAYGTQLDALGTEAQKAGTSNKYGVDSVLSGLSPNAVSLVYKMSDDFNSSPIVKNFNVIQQSNIAAKGVMKSIAERADKKATAGDDMTLMYLFAKAQDPNSVVRESEYANVADYFSSLPQNIQFQLSRVYKNTPDGRLTDESRKNVVRGLETLYKSNEQQYDQFKQSKTQQINNIAGKEVAPYFIDTYENAVPPQADEEAASEGYSPEEIRAFKEKHGLTGKQSFNKVGNTTASIQIPQESRLAFVNNNPGNLKFVGQAGAKYGEKGFAKFATPEAGYKALVKQVELDQSRGLTLEKFIHKYAPPTENNTSQYIAQAVAALGINPQTPITAADSQALAKFIAKKESSTKIS